MKATFVKARGPHQIGATVEIEAKDFESLEEMGFVVSPKTYASMQAQKEQGKQQIIKAVQVCKDSGAIAPKDETVLTASLARYESGCPADLIVELIQAEHKPAQQAQAQHSGRLTDGSEGSGVTVTATSLKDACENGYIKAREPMDKLMRSGDMKSVCRIAKESSEILKAHLMPIYIKGDNFSFRDVITAADNVDPDVGSLATGMIMLTRGFGFLKNKLTFLDKITTDLRNEAVLFGQNVITRYITPPGVLTFVPGIGMTSDNNTIATWRATITAANPAGTELVLGSAVNSGATASTNAYMKGYAYSGGGSSVNTQTRSTASATDVNVVLREYQGVSIQFNQLQIASTFRNLPGEQYDAQLYSLTEKINQDLLTLLFSSTWTDSVVTSLSLNGNSANLSTFGLKDIIRVKNAFSLNKMPDVGRFALLHSSYHDGILTDSNLLTAKAILSLIKKDAGSFEDGELPTLFGVKVLESQLAAAKSGALVCITDPTAIPAAADMVGFAGNSASAIFVARIPQDYMKVIGDIPPTAKLEVVTEPDSGLSMLVKTRVDNNLERVYQDCGLMYNFGQGDPRQGFPLKP